MGIEVTDGKVMPPMAGRITVSKNGRFGVVREGYVHRGLDLHCGAGSMGAPLYMPGPWRCVRTYRDGTDPGLSYVGHATAVEDSEGWLWRFWHLERYPHWPLGWQRSDVPVGVMGSTGASTGPHLHLEVTAPGWRLSDDFRVTGTRVNPLERYADYYAEVYVYSPGVFRAQIGVESGWNPRAKSRAGALGLCQIIPKWHPPMRGRCFDPFDSMDYAAALMKAHLKRRGWDYREALADYNVGPHAVGAARLEGLAYADKILSVSSAPVG